MKRNLILISSMVILVIASCTKDGSAPPTGRSNNISVTTNTVTVITTTSARCGGLAYTGGADSITVRGVCWATTNNPTINNSKTADGGGSGSYISNITGLISNRQYYVRAYVQNATGVQYGVVRIFRTL